MAVAQRLLRYLVMERMHRRERTSLGHPCLTLKVDVVIVGVMKRETLRETLSPPYVRIVGGMGTKT
jgi:hypothetical protein